MRRLMEVVRAGRADLTLVALMNRSSDHRAEGFHTSTTPRAGHFNSERGLPPRTEARMMMSRQS